MRRIFVGYNVSLQLAGCDLCTHPNLMCCRSLMAEKEDTILQLIDARRTRHSELANLRRRESVPSCFALMQKTPLLSCTEGADVHRGLWRLFWPPGERDGWDRRPLHARERRFFELVPFCRPWSGWRPVRDVDVPPHGEGVAVRQAGRLGHFAQSSTCLGSAS